MSIRATKLPDAGWPAGVRVCYRCGADWVDSHNWWVMDAPCKSCRPALRAEGVDVQQFKRQKVAA